MTVLTDRQWLLDHSTLVLFAGLGLVLLLATAIGRTLVLIHGNTSTLDNLNQRIDAWWIMVAVMGIAFIFGLTGLVVLFALLSFWALREFLTLTPTRHGDHSAMLLLFFIGLPVQYLLVWQRWYGLYSIFLPVYGFLVLAIAATLRGDTENFLQRVSFVQWGMMICIYFLSHVPALVTLPLASGRPADGLLLIAFLVIVVQGSDVLQYIFGKLFGRRPVSPKLSPSKTWEGLVGGIASATLLGAALWWITPFSVPVAAGMAFVICVTGFFGGLVLSAIKRDRGVKDWGRMIRGHGGILDRLDSVIFAAPVFLHLTRYWYTI